MSTATIEQSEVIQIDKSRFWAHNVEAEFALPVDAIRTAINRVGHAAHQDDGRWSWDCVLLVIDGHKMITVATDGKRIAKWETELPIRLFDEKKEFLLPKDVWKALGKMATTAYGTVEFRIYHGGGGFELGYVCTWKQRAGKVKNKLVQGVSSGRFPKWQDIFDTEEKKPVACTVEGTASDLKKIIPDPFPQYDITFWSDRVTVERSHDVVDPRGRSLQIDLRGEDRRFAEIYLNTDMLSDLLDSFHEEQKLTLILRSKGDPISVVADDQFCYVQMPCVRSKK